MVPPDRYSTKPSNGCAVLSLGKAHTEQTCSLASLPRPRQTLLINPSIFPHCARMQPCRLERRASGSHRQLSGVGVYMKILSGVREKHNYTVLSVEGTSLAHLARNSNDGISALNCTIEALSSGGKDSQQQLQTLPAE